MFGQYQVVKDRVIGFVKKPEEKTGPNRKRRGRRRSEVERPVTIPEQEFHFVSLKIQSVMPQKIDIICFFFQEFEVKGKKFQKLIWSRYSILTKYSTPGVTPIKTPLEVYNSEAFPPLVFSRVKSYMTESGEPLE